MVIRGEPDSNSASIDDWVAYREHLKSLPSQDESIRVALAVAKAGITVVVNTLIPSLLSTLLPVGFTVSPERLSPFAKAQLRQNDIMRLRIEIFCLTRVEGEAVSRLAKAATIAKI